MAKQPNNLVRWRAVFVQNSAEFAASARARARFLSEEARQAYARAQEAKAKNLELEERIESRLKQAGLYSQYYHVLEDLAEADVVSAVERRVPLTRVLTAAIEITGAQMGNIQLFDSASCALKIEAQCGFSRPFLQYFACVRGRESACGEALNSARRVIVEDVIKSPIFIGTPALDAVLDAGVRAVQSTPLIGFAGHTLGMLSTHYDHPCRPSEHDLRLLDILAREISSLLGKSASQAPQDV